MKLIFKIAINEFRYLFYSPIAWFLIIVFMIQCAVFYTGPVFDWANWQEVLLKNNPAYKDKGMEWLTVNLFVIQGILISVISNLYLFIPLLTMGLISREINSGSIKLLYSSPVKLRQIVFGKYLGIMMYNVLLISILGIFIVTGIFNIKSADYGMLLSATVGIYLLVCAYSAIGLFMSTLSTYQIVSALSSFIVIFILTRIGDLWQKYDFVRDLTYFLSLQNRTIKMLVGLLVSRDVIYFIIVAGMFVAFTLIKLRAGREAKPWYVNAGRYALVMIVALTLGYISSRPTLTGYLDTTATKRNTIPKEMQSILKELGDSTLEVTLYTNLIGGGLTRGLPEYRNVEYLSKFWDKYLRFKPGIVFKYEYYYDADARLTDSAIYKSNPGKTLKEIATYYSDAIDADISAFKSPEEMHKTIDLQPESYRLVMKLKYKGKTEFLRTYDDPEFWPDYSNVSAALKRLLGTRMPKTYFVSGEFERSIFKTGEREYAAHSASKGKRFSLANIGFDVDTVNLSTQNIPADADMLMLADPKMELNPVVLSKLKKHVETGGNLLITAEPGKQYVLNPFLDQLGVQLMNGQLVEPTYDETPDKVIPYLTGDGLSGNLEDNIKKRLKNRDTTKIMLVGVTGLNYSDTSLFKMEPLLKTVPDRVWLKAGNLIIDSTLPPMDPRAGDIKQNSFTTAVQLTRQINNKEQRIIIFGDADFAANNRTGFTTIFYNWLTYERFPITMTLPEPFDKFLNISASGAKTQKIVFVWILPGLVLLIGTILLVRRKRK